MIELSKIGVFCGSSKGRYNIYVKQTKLLADVFISNNIGLIYGGSNIGLMKVLADELFYNDIPVIGIMPKVIADRNLVNNETSSEIISCNSMAERKQIMIKESDAFIALPGGFGTLDEIFEVCSHNQLDIIDKPIGLFNVNGYFDSLLKQLDIAVNEGFLRKEHRDSIIVSDKPDKLIESLRTYEKIDITDKQWWLIK